VVETFAWSRRSRGRDVRVVEPFLYSGDIGFMYFGDIGFMESALVEGSGRRL
jgi:hypothetical protein